MKHNSCLYFVIALEINPQDLVKKAKLRKNIYLKEDFKVLKKLSSFFSKILSTHVQFIEKWLITNKIRYSYTQKGTPYIKLLR